MRSFMLRDWVALGVLLAMAGATRLIGLGTPDRLVFDESFYVPDACLYLGLGQATCGVAGEASWMHPPLAKWFIAAGIALFGYEPGGWRLLPAAAGTLTVGFVYLLARRLTGSTLAATVAGGVLALDPLSIVSSRVAMLDVFTAAAGVLAVLFTIIDDDRRRAASSRIGLVGGWRLAAGVACGVAVATKWSGLLVIGVCLVLVLAGELSRAPGGARARAARAVIPSVLVCLVAVPVLVYTASYAGRLGGDLLDFPWHQDAWLRQFGGRQLRMATFHSGLQATHPYASPAWSWLLAKRAVPYFFEIDAMGRYREILAFANPLVWLPAAAATIWAGARLVRRRSLERPELAVVVAVAGSYLPWLALSANRAFVFLHYIVPTIPFLALALGWAVFRLAGWPRTTLVTAVAIVATVTVIFWTPVIYAWPMRYDEWRARILFADCTPAELQDGRLRPRPDGGLPPPGWCWV